MAARRLLAALTIVAVFCQNSFSVEAAPLREKEDSNFQLKRAVGALSKQVAAQESAYKILIRRLNIVQTDMKDIRSYMSQVQTSGLVQGSSNSAPTTAYARVFAACTDDKRFRKGRAGVMIDGVRYSSRLGNVNLVTFNQTTGEVMDHVSFDTNKGQGGDMRAYLGRIPTDSVLLMAMIDVGIGGLPTATDHELIEEFQERLTNSTTLAEESWIEKNTDWAIEDTGVPYVSNGVVYDGKMVLDGRADTMWNPGGMRRYYNNWNIVFDFGRYYHLSAIAVQNYGDHTHDVTKFALQTSYQESPYDWKHAYRGQLEDTRNNRRQEFGGFSATARFWRFVVKETGSGYQPWLCEIDFFGYPTTMMSSFGCIVKKGSKTSWSVVDSKMVVDGATVIETVIPLYGG